MELGNILKELLEDSGITQKQLAADLNIGVTTLGNYIRGVREPDFSTLRLLATYFNVTTDFLLNHSTGVAKDHSEEELLRLYRSLTPEKKALFLDQGKLLVRYALREKSNARE